MRSLTLALFMAFATAQTAEAACRPEWPAFADLAGDWSVRLTWRQGSGDYDVSEATAGIEADAVRCVLTERLDAPNARTPMTFLIVTGLANPGQIERVLHDSEHARFLVFGGGWDGAAARLQRETQMGERLLVNRTTVRPGHDAFSVETELSIDGGATWRRVHAMEYRRKR